MYNKEKQDAEKYGMFVVSAGRHTRMGDVLEYALEGVAFETVNTGDLPRAGRKGRKVLFAASADRYGENAQMRELVARLHAGGWDLSGSACAMIADGEQGGPLHTDAVKLLAAANAAGAELMPRPLLESDRELKRFYDGKETPFERYRAAARALVARLAAYELLVSKRPRVRLLTALEDGAANGWRQAVGRVVTAAGGELADAGEADTTGFLCENTDGLPDGKTLALLGGGGRARFLIASPATGSDLYTLAVLERACVRGDFALAPRAVTVFEGMSAAEALADEKPLKRIVIE